MSDCIDRQTIINLLTSRAETLRGLYGDLGGAASGVRKLIQTLPSVEPEQKKGHWVPVTNMRGGFECDQCHNYAPSYQNGDEHLSYYCPNCGAEMNRGDR